MEAKAVREDVGIGLCAYGIMSCPDVRMEAEHVSCLPVTQVRCPIGRIVGARERGMEERGACYVVRARRLVEDAEVIGIEFGRIWGGYRNIWPIQSHD